MATQESFSWTKDEADLVWLDRFCARLKYQPMIDNENYNPTEPEDPVTNPKFVPNVSKIKFWKQKVWEWTKLTAADGDIMLKKSQLMSQFDSDKPTEL